MAQWTKNGSPVLYTALLNEFIAYEQTLSSDETDGLTNERDRCQNARIAVLKVEGDGKAILPDSDPNKQIFHGYFGKWMDANGVKFE